MRMCSVPQAQRAHKNWGFCVGNLNPSGSQMNHFEWGLQLETDFRRVTNISQNQFLSLVIWTCHWKTLAQQSIDVQIMIQTSYAANPHTAGNNYNNDHNHHHPYVNPAVLLESQISCLWAQWPVQPLTRRLKWKGFNVPSSVSLVCCHLDAVEISTDLHLMFWIMHWRYVLETALYKLLHAVAFHNSTNS